MVWGDMCCDRCLHPTYRQFGQFCAAKIVFISQIWKFVCLKFAFEIICRVLDWFPK